MIASSVSCKQNDATPWDRIDNKATAEKAMNVFGDVQCEHDIINAVSH
jgi:hypothetical protein